ncbi:TadE family protein [Pseudonocardia sp. DLS-67]
MAAQTLSVDEPERGGSTSVEMALLWLAMLVMIMAVVQVALVFYAGQLALTAAEDGLRAGRYVNASSVVEARRDAEAFLRRAAGTSLQSPSVAAEVDPATGLLRVRVSGDALSVVPGVSLQVTKEATGAVERVTP